MATEIDPARLKKITAEMIAALTSPGYVQAMATLKQTPLDKRLSVAAKLLTPDALKKAGVPLPAGMRISSRYFEPSSPTVIRVGDHGAVLAGTVGDDVGPVGAWGCACGGGATVCGGAGGGS